MKRIVDGKTYNTDTSTLLARTEWEDENRYEPTYGWDCVGELYQTRGGAFFVLVTKTKAPDARDPDDEGKQRVECSPLTAEEAQSWLLEGGDVEVFRNPFEDPPEAEAEAEPGATIYIRVPSALKRDVDAAAAKAGVSVNVWAMRCVERCLKPTPVGSE
jgi:hypothetical protein